MPNMTQNWRSKSEIGSIKFLEDKFLIPLLIRKTSTNPWRVEKSLLSKCWEILKLLLFIAAFVFNL